MNCRYYPENSGLRLFSIQIQRIPDRIPVRAIDLQQIVVFCALILIQ